MTDLLSSLSLSHCLRWAPGLRQSDPNSLLQITMMLRISVANLTGNRCAGAGVPMSTDDTNAASAVTTAALMTIHYDVHAIKHKYMTANVGIIADGTKIMFQMHVNFRQWGDHTIICE